MVDLTKDNLNIATNEAEIREDNTSLTSTTENLVENDMLCGEIATENEGNAFDNEEITFESEEISKNSNQPKDNKFVAFFKKRFAPKSTAGRIWEIDFLRGLCVFLMLFDHLAIMLTTEYGPAWYGYPIDNVFNHPSFMAQLCSLLRWYVNTTYVSNGLRAIGHPIVLFIFFSISGISCSFSRSNLKRGIVLAVVSAIYSVVTYVLSITIDSSLLVTFGVLHFYAVCILTWSIICIVVKDNKIAKMIVSGFIVIVVAVLYHCYKAPATTPQWLFWIWPFKQPDGTFSAFYTQGMVSPGDLFTLIPYASFFFAGTFLQPLLYSKRRSLLPRLDRSWHRPFTFLGRHAIGVYLTHIVAVAVILCLVGFLFYGSWGLF